MLGFDELELQIGQSRFIQLNLLRNEIAALIKRRNRNGTTVEEKIQKIRSEKVLKEELDDDDDDEDDVDDDEDGEVSSELIAQPLSDTNSIDINWQHEHAVWSLSYMNKAVLCFCVHFGTVTKCSNP